MIYNCKFIARILRFILFGLCFCVVPAHSQESKIEDAVQSRPAQIIETNSYKLIFHVLDEKTVIDIINKEGDKNLFTYQAESATQFFISADEVKISGHPNPLLITRWTNGAYGEALIIFDPLMGAGSRLKEFNASSHITYEIENGETLQVYYYSKNIGPSSSGGAIKLSIKKF